MLASAVVAEAVGIHAIFGAFIFGAILPHESPIAQQLAHPPCQHAAVARREGELAGGNVAEANCAR